MYQQQVQKQRHNTTAGTSDVSLLLLSKYGMMGLLTHSEASRRNDGTTTPRKEDNTAAQLQIDKTMKQVR